MIVTITMYNNHQHCWFNNNHDYHLDNPQQCALRWRPSSQFEQCRLLKSDPASNSSGNITKTSLSLSSKPKLTQSSRSEAGHNGQGSAGSKIPTSSGWAESESEDKSHPGGHCHHSLHHCHHHYHTSHNLCHQSSQQHDHHQVTLEKDNGTFGVVVRGGSHDVPMRCRPFTVVQVKTVITWMIIIILIMMLMIMTQWWWRWSWHLGWSRRPGSFGGNFKTGRSDHCRQREGAGWDETAWTAGF